MGATPEVFVTSNQSELSLNGTLHMYESNREKLQNLVVQASSRPGPQEAKMAKQHLEL